MLTRYQLEEENADLHINLLRKHHGSDIPWLAAAVAI